MRMLLVAAAVMLFVWLSAEVEAGQMRGFDRVVRADVHAESSPPLTRFMAGATWLGSWEGILVGTLAAAALFWRRHWRQAVIRLAAVMLGGSIWLNVLKAVFRRPRPPATYFGPHLGSFSYPSGHALTALCFYGILAAILAERARSRRARVLVWAAAVILVAVVGLSRVYLGVHYPSDVLGGYLLGLAWTVGVWETTRPRRGSTMAEPNTS